jgi:hypothetical protein
VGKILYDAYLDIELDDRVLAHLQLAMSIKLRRREGFFFTWQKLSSSGEGRSAVWIDASIPIQFIYFGSRMPAINRDWVEALRVSSNSAGGLQVLAEEPTAESSTPLDATTADKRSRIKAAVSAQPE